LGSAANNRTRRGMFWEAVAKAFWAVASVFSGEGKLFGKSFPSPEPPSFQKLFKKG